MIVIVDPPSYAAYAAELREMHRMRYRVFKGRLDWDVTVEDGMERDQFDVLDPTYVLAFGDADRLVGSWRLLPTVGPTMLGDVFPELLDGEEMPCSPTIWETSRFVDDARSHGDGSLGSINHTTSEIFCGLIEHCIAEGIQEIVTVYDLLIARILPRVGCHPKWRGSVHRVGKTRALAGRFDADDEQLARIRAIGGIAESVLSDRLEPTHASTEITMSGTAHV